MSTQLLMSNSSSTLSRPQTQTGNSEIASSAVRSTACAARKVDLAKCPYKADQQVKFLHLQAEVESLLLQLQTIKQQRSITDVAAIEPNSGCNDN
ncbi:MAG: hypothetical protein ACRC62_39905 [Microcoleus sp.]